MNVLELEKLSKSFSQGFWGRKRTVLSDLSLSLAKGEVYGILGHNGAGKSTTMRLVLGLLKPDSGRVTLFGRNGASNESLEKVGYLGDDVGVYPHLSADDTLQMTGEIFRLPTKVLKSRKSYLLHALELKDHTGRKVKKFSKGMRQRLGIAVSLMNDPDFLILDEPYSGLDPIGRRKVREFLLSLKQEGKTILMSSHIVPDIEAVCDRVGILANGRLEKSLDLEQIYKQKSNPVEITVTGVDPQTFEGVGDEIQLVYQNPEAIVVRCQSRELMKSIISKTYTFGGDIIEVKPLKFNLEDYLFEQLAGPLRAQDAPEVPDRTEKHYAHHS